MWFPVQITFVTSSTGHAVNARCASRIMGRPKCVVLILLRICVLSVLSLTKCVLPVQLFQRCLMKVLHIDLWKCYLSYVRETKGKLPSYK